MEAACPHCHKPIELLEPKDLDDAGLTPNVRLAAIKRGALKPWLTLRGGRFFLFLKHDVDAVLEDRTRTHLAKVARDAGARTPEEEARVIKALEEALGNHSSTPQRKPTRGSK